MIKVAARVAVGSALNAARPAMLAAPATASAPAGERWRAQVRVRNLPGPPVSRPRAYSSRAAAFRQASWAPNAETSPAALTATPTGEPR
jgi:hypothetical protein